MRWFVSAIKNNHYMNNKQLLLFLFITLTTINISGQHHVSDKFQAPTGLLCDLLDDHRSGNPMPVLISETHPAFSWIMNNPMPYAQQKAYQIIVSDHLNDITLNNGNVWNSGKVKASSSAGIIYQGNPLLPDKQYFWKVKLWDKQGSVSEYSACSSFKTTSELCPYATNRYGLVTTEQLPVQIRQTGRLLKADFGKDAFGKLKLRLFSKTNDTIQIRLGESLNPDESINRKPSGTIRYAEHRLGIQPGFNTYNLQLNPDKRNTGPDAIKIPDSIGVIMPFRYCEIEGLKDSVQKDQMIRIAVNYPFDEEAAHFSCSDTLLNRIWDLCKYSVKATSFAGVYVDGDRERIPYEADALINQLCHYAVDREYSLARYSHEYLIMKPTWPTEWILQSVLLAWNDYLYTGDIRSASHFYDDLVAKTLIPLQDSTGLLTLKGVSPKILKDIHFRASRKLEDIVDWPHSGMLGVGKKEAGETDGFVFTDYNAVTNAYFYKSLLIMKSIAADLGKKKDAGMFEAKAKILKESYHRLLWDEKQGAYCDGISTRHSSLHTNFFALAFGLVDQKDVEQVLSFIKSRGMACSVYGSQFLLDALYDNGGGDYGMELLTARNDRSWYNMMHVGSSITLEAWDNKYKPNQDWNHAWGAAPVNIISRKIMGIEPLMPGWSEFKIDPKSGTLTHAEITVPTIKGRISMSFVQSETSFEMKTNIPANTIARVYLPLNGKIISKVVSNGKIIPVTVENGKVSIRNVKSGLNTFYAEYK